MTCPAELLGVVGDDFPRDSTVRLVDRAKAIGRVRADGDNHADLQCVDSGRFAVDGNIAEFRDLIGDGTGRLPGLLIVLVIPVFFIIACSRIRRVGLLLGDRDGRGGDIGDGRLIADLLEFDFFAALPLGVGVYREGQAYEEK